MKIYNIIYWLKYIWLYKILKNEKAYYKWADKEITKIRREKERTK